MQAIDHYRPSPHHSPRHPTHHRTRSSDMPRHPQQGPLPPSYSFPPQHHAAAHPPPQSSHHPQQHAAQSSSHRGAPAPPHTNGHHAPPHGPRHSSSARPPTANGVNGASGPPAHLLAGPAGPAHSSQGGGRQLVHPSASTRRPASAHGPAPGSAGAFPTPGMLGGPTPAVVAAQAGGPGVQTAATAGEAATVAQILSDGEGGLREEMLERERKPLNPLLERLAKETEQTWVAAGKTAEAMGNMDQAARCYESALKHNPYCVEALTQVASIYRRREEFRRATEYFSRLLNIHEGSGEIWGALGHCYLMIDDLQKAYTSYQQALYHLQSPKSEPKLWYGIGILYDRYGSLDHAEEAFSSVIKMDPSFEKANEIYFRLGIIYKQQRKHEHSLDCFRFILRNPPPPLTEVDIWFQIGHVYEQMGDCDRAKEAYERVLADNSTHAKVLQQLGGLYCRMEASFYDPDQSVVILTRSLETDSQDPFSWYLLGRAYMTQNNYSKAYEAYQQAVYRDGKNPAFWCSIGVLYYGIQQYHDSLDAYSRAIRIDPYISEVWYNLGALYESCNDQLTDALDAYQRAAQLDANNAAVHRRLAELRQFQQTGRPVGHPPSPRDMSPSSASWGTASGLGGPPEHSFNGPAAQLATASPNGAPHGSSSEATSQHRPGTGAGGAPSTGSGSFNYGPPPPAAGSLGQVDRRLSGGHGPLAPMDIDRSPRSGRPIGAAAGGQAHNLPHIAQVYDGHHSRAASPMQAQLQQAPRPEPLRRGMGGLPGESPRSSPSSRGMPYHEDVRQGYPGPMQTPPHSHHLHPSEPAPPSVPHHGPSWQQAPHGRHVLAEDARAPERSRYQQQQRPPSGDRVERLGRLSPIGYPPQNREYGPYSAQGPPLPQHQSPYDPRHPSDVPQRGPAPPAGRTGLHDHRGPPPVWQSDGPLYGSMPPGVERRPASAQSAHHFPPQDQQTIRWDPRYEMPSQPLGPPSDAAISGGGSSSVSRRTSEEQERQRQLATQQQQHAALAGQQRAPSPTPSLAASEYSAGGTTKKRGRGKSAVVKDEEYAPTLGSGKKRKAPFKAADGAPKEKRDRKKAERPKPRKSVVSKGPDGTASSSPAAQPVTDYSSVRSSASVAAPLSGASVILPERPVDEDYDDDEEGASTLLNLASQPTVASASASLTTQAHILPRHSYSSSVGGPSVSGRSASAAPQPHHSHVSHPHPHSQSHSQAGSYSNSHSRSPEAAMHSPPTASLGRPPAGASVALGLPVSPSQAQQRPRQASFHASTVSPPAAAAGAQPSNRAASARGSVASAASAAGEGPDVDLDVKMESDAAASLAEREKDLDYSEEGDAISE